MVKGSIGVKPSFLTSNIWDFREHNNTRAPPPTAYIRKMIALPHLPANHIVSAFHHIKSEILDNHALSLLSSIRLLAQTAKWRVGIPS